MRLRAAGRSINQIAAQLGVAKSTAYQWVRHLPLNPDEAGRGRRPRRAGPAAAGRGHLLVRGSQVQAMAAARYGAVRQHRSRSAGAVPEFPRGLRRGPGGADLPGEHSRVRRRRGCRPLVGAAAAPASGSVPSDRAQAAQPDDGAAEHRGHLSWLSGDHRAAQPCALLADRRYDRRAVSDRGRASSPRGATRRS
ncbi:helix-turn-helix domain-containing protein [Micromonospora sp. NPDC050980]|uniref:helix-turn-helix domain-containing protein n=1 Tax=Micromonospora sp. NPDC050980 TaxID=3155161 RepID=UPI0033C705CC